MTSNVFFRYLGKLKTFTGNRAHPERSIAEGWLSEELFNFSSLYFDDDVETRYNRTKRVATEPDVSSEDNSGILISRGVPTSMGVPFKLSQPEWAQAYRYVLVNSPIAKPLLR